MVTGAGGVRILKFAEGKAGGGAAGIFCEFPVLQTVGKKVRVSFRAASNKFSYNLFKKSVDLAHFGEKA